MYGISFAFFVSALLHTVCGDGCSLISSEGNPATTATFQCTDNSIWRISAEREGGSEYCIYHRFVIDPSARVSQRRSRLTCNTVLQHIQDLVSNVNIPLTPDALLPVVDYDNLQPAVY